MQRRRFLRTAAAGAIGLGYAAVAGCAPSAPEPRDFARPDLLALFDDVEHVRALGEAYRAAFPDEDDTDVLTAALAAEVDGSDGARLAEALRARVQQDFEEGRTVELDGWILSSTEARQCALFSLVSV